MSGRIFSEMIIRELKFLMPRALIFDIIIYIITLPVYRFGLEIPLGLLSGTAVMALNFIILGKSSEYAVEKTVGMAKGFMFGSYILRLFIVGLLFYAGVKLPQIDLIAAALPQLYPKIAYTLDAVIKKKGR